MVSDAGARMLRWLHSVHPRLEVIRHVEERYVSLELPAPAGAEYSFRLFLYEEAFDLTAVPVGDPEDAIFWHQSFERLGAPSLAPAEQAFGEFVLDVISRESRITYHRGWLFHRFTCEVLRDSGWERIGGRVLALRSSYRAPPVQGRTRVYRSAAVVTGV